MCCRAARALPAHSAWRRSGSRAEIARRLAGKPQIVELERAEAPVQQVVLTGDDADLTALPVHLQHGLDGAPYISASIDYTRRSENRLDQCRASAG